jgi:hypothetical protein
VHGCQPRLPGPEVMHVTFSVTAPLGASAHAFLRFGQNALGESVPDCFRGIKFVMRPAGVGELCRWPANWQRSATVSLLVVGALVVAAAGYWSGLKKGFELDEVASAVGDGVVAIGEAKLLGAANVRGFH